jgi:cytochrome P450
MPTGSSSTAPARGKHLSFGFGIHRCVGNRVAELQLAILWEEILKRFPVIEVLAPPRRLHAVFVHGITSLMVRIPGGNEHQGARIAIRPPMVPSMGRV